jgi:hypothetical protein
MNKKLILALILIPALFPKLYAQKGLHAGIVIQPSLLTMRPPVFSNSSEQYDRDYNQTIRTSIGVVLDHHFNPYLGVGVNIIYSPQGQKFFSTNDSGVYESHYYKFDFIKMPLYFSFNSGGDKARFFGNFGPQLMILMSAKDHYRGTDVSLTDNYAPINLGFHFGIGMGFFISENLMLTFAPNFDVAYLNYNYTYSQIEPPAYIGKSPVTTCFGMQFGIKYVKNEINGDDHQSKTY